MQPKGSLVLASVPCFVCGERDNHALDCRWNTETPAQAVMTWQTRYEAAADRLFELSFQEWRPSGNADTLFEEAREWANQCVGAAVLAERLGL